MGTADISANQARQPQLPKEPPPILTRLYYATAIQTLRTVQAPGTWLKGWQDYFSPPPLRPDVVKRYDCRPHLPVRIFFPDSYDQTSPQTLPTLFTIHGGGFCIGEPEDDDHWNRFFANLHSVLVIALNYSKAPWYPFPTGLHDVEALFLAALADESLPIDPARVAVGGFSAGGNLALALCQLPSVKNHATAAPKAVVPVYPPINFSVPQHTKRDSRPYKEGSGLTGIRGQARDYVLDFADMFDWSYIPYGADLQDPLISPLFAKREDLPKWVFVIGAELDFLAFEDMALACRLAGRPVPSVKAGRQEKAKTQELELTDERFHFESKETGVRWLLVPDVIHAFDLHPAGRMMSDDESWRDSEVKTLKYMKVLGEWLLGTAWR